MLFATILPSYGQAPVINSFGPAKGPVGTAVTITGGNFNTTPGNNIIYFGAVRARVISASASALSVEVPAGATFKPISVLNTVSGLTGYSAYPFHSTFPTKRAIYELDFDPRTDYTTGNEPNCVALADLDGDGKTDMVVSNQASKSISVFKSTSTSGSINAATFQPKFEISTHAAPVKVEITDIDGDGKPDIVVLTATSVEVFKNNAAVNSLDASSFNPGVNFPLSGSPTAITIADIDGDGKPDIGIAYASPNKFSTGAALMHNTCTWGVINSSSFGPIFPIYTEFGNFSINAADLTGDGKPEIIVVHTFSRVLRVYKNVAQPGSLSMDSFLPNLSFATAVNPLVVNVGDMDGDDLPDMQTSNYGGMISPAVQDRFFISVLLRRNYGSDIVAASFTSEKNFAAGRVPLSSALGDMDGDGLLDPVNVNYLDGNLSVRRNASTPNNVAFSNNIHLPALVNPNHIKVADMDGDGKPDIIVTNIGSNKVSIYRNNAASQESITFPNLAPVVYGVPDFAPGATSNKPGVPVTYTSSNPAVATITASGLIHITGAGSTVITANQDGSTTFPPATPVSQTLLVLRAPLTVTAQNAQRPYNTNNPEFILTYSGFVYNDAPPLPDAAVTVSTPATITSIPGTYPIVVTGNITSANYNIGYRNGVLTIDKLTQTITFPQPGDKHFGEPGFTLGAIASSGLQVSYEANPQGIITIMGNFVQTHKTGTVTVTAKQAGNEIYEPASADATLTVLPGNVIVMSNTITPNGDGINDNWLITGLDENSGRVTIFNRYGKTVFQSKGYPKPFNGTNGTGQLPAGVYYYMINFFDGRKPMSGSLTIIY